MLVFLYKKTNCNDEYDANFYDIFQPADTGNFFSPRVSINTQLYF